MKVGETYKDGRKNAKYDGYRDCMVAGVVGCDCHIGGGKEKQVSCELRAISLPSTPGER